MKKNSGFTLVEVIISMVILATVLTINYQWIFLGKKIWQSSSEELSWYREMKNSFEQIINDIKSIALQQNVALIGRGGYIKLVGTNEKIEFFAIIDKEFPIDRKSNIVEIRYLLSEEKINESTRKLIRQTFYQHFEELEEEEKKAEIILNNVKEFKLKYYDGQNEEWLDEWDIKQRMQERLSPFPTSIKIEITLENKEKKISTSFSTIVRIGL